MKKRIWLLVFVLMVTSLLTSISVISAEPESHGVIECALNITLDDYADGTYWNGRVDGNRCEIAGRIRFFAVREEYACPGDTIHFVETFIIEPDSGGSIEGKNWGVWNLNTGQFRSHGWVMSSEEYPDLVGNQYHEMGTTSTTDLSARPIYATDGNMKLVPGDRPLDSIPATLPQNPCFPST